MLSVYAISSETLKAGSSGEFEEGLGGVEVRETVTIDDSVEDGGNLAEKLGNVLGVLEWAFENSLDQLLLMM